MEWDGLKPPKPKRFDPLGEAEIALLKALRGEEGGADTDGSGLIWISEKTPDALGEDEALRADFLRHLLLAGDDRAPLPERGLLVAGARIDGVLDLEGAELTSSLGLIRCAFDRAPVLRGARCRSLFFNGATMPGLRADGLRCTGDLFLRNGFKATGELRLLGAEIGGDLSCVGATLDGGGGYALNADGARVVGSVFLRGGFKATGMVRLLGAEIGGNVECDGATLDGGEGYALNADRARVVGSVFLQGGFKATGMVRLLGAEIGGDLSCIGATLDGGGGDALGADGARVAGGVFMRDGFKAKGALDFTEARLGAFVDGGACGPAPDLAPLGLTGCTFGAIHCRDGSFTAEARLRWLERCESSRPGPKFHPGPFEQLARVFRESGHPEDARAILIEKERRQRQSVHDRRLREGGAHGWLITIPGAVWDGLLRLSVAYGLRPLRAFHLLFVGVLLGWGMFHAADQAGALKPNSPFVLRAPEWVACAAPATETVTVSDGDAFPGRLDHPSQRDCFEDQPEAASWPEFNALVYSVDTLLPLVGLEMQAHWIPDEDKGWIGPLARVYLWFHIAAGWALSLLAVAGFSGIVKSD